MPFKVSARTILLLGAELISSDAIAFYELIKNAFDAGSPRVDIDVIVHMRFDAYVSHLKFIKPKLGERSNIDKQSFDRCREVILDDLDSSAPYAKKLRGRISQADSWARLNGLLEEVNYIEIKDTGCGMSLDDLNDVYLTIGTRSRLVQREEQRDRLIGGDDESSFRPILGEKGLGRLSTMRLGWRLYVETSKEGESNWNILTIDWRNFTRDADDFIEAISVSPSMGHTKNDPDVHGTRIAISALTSGWDRKKLQDVATHEFSKLTDPFTPSLRYPISLRYNNEGVSIRPVNKILFEYAHATLQAKFSTDDEKPLLVGKVNYLLRNREKTFSLDQTDLLSIIEAASPAALLSLGPFSVSFYWFNRRILGELEGIGDRKQVQELLTNWAGGLMVFRDGFRVNPYGSPDDDWLNLDRKALAASGYKVNRRQIVGKVDISSLYNVALTDQTNREGLRDCEEKRTLIKLLQHVMEAEFRAFLNLVDKEARARETVTFADLEERVENQELQLEQSMQLLTQKYPEVAKDTQIVTTIKNSIDHIREMIKDAKQLADSIEKDYTQMLHLAGLGLMVEILAHELDRATQHTLITLANGGQRQLGLDTESLFATLEAQLKTLQKRLRILDPLSTSGRQVKEWFDLVAWVQDILSSHEAQFRRHHIKCSPVNMEPVDSPSSLRVKMVKGMIVQIIENLLSNSVYWLDQQRKLDSDFLPEITVIIDTKKKAIRVTDNGPGVPISRKDEVFQPFVTTKPPGEGKGLGLYISREIAKYHQAELFLSDEPTIHDDRLNTFILRLEVQDK
jgi:signal transduction histidine kinase